MTSTRIGAIAPEIRRRGALLKDDVLDKLVYVRVERAAGLIGRATLRFTDNGYGISAGDSFALGTEISISEPDAGALIDGTVTGINLEQSARSVPELVVVIDDAAYKLTRGTTVKTYLNGTYTDALQQLASRNGMTPQIDSSALVMEYLLQAGSDLAFLNMVTERLGSSWYVDGKSTLVIKKFALGSPAATLTLGDDLKEFSVRASGLRPTAVSVHGWSPDQQDDVTDTNQTASAGNPPTLVKPYTGSGPTSGLSAASTSIADGRPLTAGEAQVLANSYYDEWSSAAVVARGTADVNSSVKPGVTVAVKDAGPASGNYLVTSVEHVYDRTGFSTKFVAGPRRPAGLVDTLGPPVPDAGFVMPGMVVGVVTDCNDPDNAGRVKVRYTGVDGEVGSPWARVVTLGGGSARGAVFSPEVKDEVLVGFEHGDTRRPVVMGGLYSKQNTLPTGEKYIASDGQVNYRRITSRKNHMMEFADGEQPAEQHILLLVGTAAHKLRLGADRFDIEVAQGKGLTIKAGDAKFDISTSGDVTIEGNNVTIKAKMALDIEGGTTANLKGNTQTTVQGMDVQVKSDGIAAVQASGPLTLKGAMVAIN